MRYISMFSGIEAASVAAAPLGWTPLCFAEIEAFPSAVLAHHYPSVPNVGDITAHDWSQYRGMCDLVIGGPPCQAFSVAGLRQSLADDRGNLSLAYVGAIRAIDPLWSITENVPGWLSTSDNAFGCVLAGLVGADTPLVSPLKRGRWPHAGVVTGPERTAAWRVLDAQYFGLAQRRKRVFVLSVRGARNWACADALLSLGESLSGHPAPRREAREDVAPTLAERTRSGGGLGTDFDCDGGLIHCPEVVPQAMSAKWAKGSSGPAGDETANLIAHSLRAHKSHANGGVMPAVAFAHQAGGKQTTLGYSDDGQCQTLGANQTPAVVFQCQGSNVGEMVTLRAGNGNETGSHASTQETDAGTLLRTLREEVGAEAFTQWGLGILDSLLPAEVLRSRLHGCGVRFSTDFSRRWLVYHALSRPEAHSEGLVQAMREAEREGRASQGWRPSEQLARELGAYLSELSQPGPQAARFMRDLWEATEGLGLLRQALSAVQEVGRSARHETEPAPSPCQVRRLTVEECEFLQGFPRGFTAVPYRGKPAADGPRYKALGNSMAVPVIGWICRRIDLVQDVCRDLKVSA